VATAFYLSIDTVWQSSDQLLASQITGALGAGSTTVSSKALTIPSSLNGGQYYILYVADNTQTIAEANENNNVEYKALAVNYSIDLSLLSPAITPSVITAGNNIVASSSVKNNGASTTPAAQLGYFLSTNQTWDAADVQLGVSALSALSSGSTVSKTATVTIPSTVTPGTYYVLFFADHSGLLSETSEANNTIALPVQINGITTGIGEGAVADELKDFNLYPNPTAGQLTIVLDQLQQPDREYKVELYDITGNVVMSRDMVFVDNRLELWIPDGLVKGIYIVSIRTERKKITRKIILNR
jgi:subtilase family serine protease